jgi:N-methylhydantoinase A
MAQELRIPRVIVPLHAGVFSALGLVTADARYDAHRSYVVRGSQADPAHLETVFEELEREVVSKVDRLDFIREHVAVQHQIDMRYLGQAHEVQVEVPARLARDMNRQALSELLDLFHEKHLDLFGHASPESEVELITLTVTAVGSVGQRGMRKIQAGTADPAQAYKGNRKAYFEETDGYVDCATYERARLEAGNLVHGPAIIEQMDTTTVVPPGETAKVDGSGTLIVELADRVTAEEGRR